MWRRIIQLITMLFGLFTIFSVIYYHMLYTQRAIADNWKMGPAYAQQDFYTTVLIVLVTIAVMGFIFYLTRKKPQ